MSASALQKAILALDRATTTSELVEATQTICGLKDLEAAPTEMSSDLSKYKTHKGWPITVSVNQQYNRKPIGYLPTIKMKQKNFVVRVSKESSGELVYARRVTGKSFRPKVFEKGSYSVEAGGPGKWKSFKNQKIK